MPTSFESIKFNANGGLDPHWLEHTAPNYAGMIGTVEFKAGRSVRTVEGAELRRLIAAAGNLFNSVPAKAAPEAPKHPLAGTAHAIGEHTVVEPTDEETDDSLVQSIIIGAPSALRPDDNGQADDRQTHPPLAPAPGPVETQSGVREEIDALPDDREALRAIAAARGIKASPAWDVKKLKKELTKAAAAQ